MFLIEYAKGRIELMKAIESKQFEVSAVTIEVLSGVLSKK